MIAEIEKQIDDELRVRNPEVLVRAIRILDIPQCQWSIHRLGYEDICDNRPRILDPLNWGHDTITNHHRYYVRHTDKLERWENIPSALRIFHHLHMGGLKACRQCVGCLKCGTTKNRNKLL